MSAAISDPQSDIDNMRKQEQEAVNSIKKYLIEGYDFRRSKFKAKPKTKVTNKGKGKDKDKDKGEPQNPGPSPQNEIFWKDIISTFEGYIAEINQQYSDMFNISERRKRRRRSSTENESKQIEENSTEDGSLQSEEESTEERSIWFEEDPIEEFKAYYSIIDAEFLKYSRHRKECTRLFQQLIAEMETAISPKGQVETSISILGRTSFSYISKMLDINDNNICSLLPFLLTAYVYTFRNNRFMNRGDTSVEGAFSDENVETIRVSETKKKLEVLGDCFGLSDCKIKFPSSKRMSSNSECRQVELSNSENKQIELPDSKSEQEDLFPYSVRYSSKYPYLEHREVLDSVFAIWCGIICGICECEATKMNPAFCEKVDIVLCAKLYLYYTDKAYYQNLMSKGFPSKEKIYQHILLRCASTPPFMPDISFRTAQEI